MIWATAGSTASCWRSVYLLIPARSIRSAPAANACPPEDCGGIPGFYDLLNALGDPMHEQHDELQDWVGDDYDPDAFSIDKVNQMLTPRRRSRDSSSRG